MPPRFETSQLLELHRRLCDGDRTASEELAALILDALVEGISRQFPRSDEHMVFDAIARIRAIAASDQPPPPLPPDLTHRCHGCSLLTICQPEETRYL